MRANAIWNTTIQGYHGYVRWDQPTLIQIEPRDGRPVPEEIMAEFIEAFTSQVTAAEVREIPVDGPPL